MGHKARTSGGSGKDRARSRTLHTRAQRYNWDSGEEGLERILADPACDYGTALLIFWMGAPGFDRQYAAAKDVDSWRLSTFTFLRALEERLLRGDFATSSILFNPQFDRTTVSPHGHDWTAEYSDIEIKRPIPSPLYEPSCKDLAWEERGHRPIENTANRLT